MTTKLRIKAGSIEFEYETDAQLSSDAIEGLFSNVQALIGAGAGDTPETLSVGTSPQDGAEPSNSVALHTTSIAAKLGSKSGSDLALAAAAHLQIVLGKDKFTRTELLSDMRSASSRYTKNMSGNLTKIINTLVDNKKLNQIGTHTYALEATTRASLESQLASEH